MFGLDLELQEEPRQFWKKQLNAKRKDLAEGEAKITEYNELIEGLETKQVSSKPENKRDSEQTPSIVYSDDKKGKLKTRN